MKMDLNFSDNYIVQGKFSIAAADTEYSGELQKAEGKLILETEKKKLRALQEKM